MHHVANVHIQDYAQFISVFTTKGKKPANDIAVRAYKCILPPILFKRYDRSLRLVV
jgi:hypothetical protein